MAEWSARQVIEARAICGALRYARIDSISGSGSESRLMPAGLRDLRKWPDELLMDGSTQAKLELGPTEPWLVNVGSVNDARFLRSL